MPTTARSSGSTILDPYPEATPPQHTSPAWETRDKFMLHMQHKIVVGSSQLVAGIRADQTPAGEERSRALETAGKGNGLVLDPSSVDSVRTNPYWGMNVVGSF